MLTFILACNFIILLHSISTLCSKRQSRFFRWIEACLNEELPPTTELEEGLRNGVYLAKLGNFFAPDVVFLKRIYDREQTRYKVTLTFENIHTQTDFAMDGLQLICYSFVGHWTPFQTHRQYHPVAECNDR